MYLNEALMCLNEAIEEAIERAETEARAEGYREGVEAGIEDALGGKAAEHYREALKAEGAAEEKERRIYYQHIVYGVCNWIDRMLGRSVSKGEGTICGTFDTPSKGVRDGLEGVCKRQREQLDSLYEYGKEMGAAEERERLDALLEAEMIDDTALVIFTVASILSGGLTGMALAYALKTGDWFWFAIGVATVIGAGRMVISEAMRLPD